MPITIENHNNNIDNTYILIVKPYGKMVADDLNTFTTRFEDCVDTLQKMKCIFDLRNMEDTPFDLTMKLAMFMKKNKPKIKKSLLCSVIIVNNGFVRNFLNFLFTIIEPSAPYHITNNIEDINEYIC
jgi:hypothetical protein